VPKIIEIDLYRTVLEPIEEVITIITEVTEEVTLVTEEALVDNDVTPVKLDVADKYGKE